MWVNRDGRSIRVPDFMILGAAKSGTTSLFRYLLQHPQIFFPADWKEPGYFCFAGAEWYTRKERGGRTDRMWNSVVPDLDAYIGLFEKAPEEAVLGEATPEYLLLPENTIKNIDYVYGTSADRLRFVVILRNPVDRVWSHYWMMVRDGYETLDFEQATNAETIGARMEAGMHPAYDYLSYGLYGRQLQTYMTRFGRERFAVHTFEEMKENPVALCKGLFRFLGVSEEFDPNVSILYNYSGKLRFPTLHRLLFGHDTAAKRVLRSLIPYDLLQETKARLQKWNCQKVEMPGSVRRCLVEYYREDIQLLEDLLGRDFSSWRAIS